MIERVWSFLSTELHRRMERKPSKEQVACLLAVLLEVGYSSEELVAARHLEHVPDLVWKAVLTGDPLQVADAAEPKPLRRPTFRARMKRQVARLLVAPMPEHAPPVVSWDDAASDSGGAGDGED